MRYLVLILSLIATATNAQQVPRDGDVLYSKVDLTELVSGKMLEFYTGGFSRYGTDGNYDYRYEIDGAPAPGTYEVRDDSFICTVFHNGFNRCDLFVQSNDRVVLIIENGERYPVREITELE